MVVKADGRHRTKVLPEHKNHDNTTNQVEQRKGSGPEVWGTSNISPAL